MQAVYQSRQWRLPMVLSTTLLTSLLPQSLGTPECPGMPVCSGHGDCEKTTGICWCEAGYGGTDCSSETPLFLEVTSIKAPELQDMLGRYRLDGMYLYEVTDPHSGVGIDPLPSQVKFVHFDHASSGWAVSKFNSSCIDDICFFAYAPDTKIPPPKGYVYGGPILHVYYKQLLFDDADLDPTMRRGYHMTFSYTPDPNVLGVSDLSEYNGRYVLQPRYTHMVNKKYAIMPIDLKNPGKKWVATGLLGDPRKRKIIVSAVDPSENRYMPPRGPWMPEELEFALKPACANHVGNLACLHLEPQCMMGDTDGDWVRKCCRDTCHSCQESRLSCPLPKVNNLVAAMMHAKLNRLNLPGLDKALERSQNSTASETPKPRSSAGVGAKGQQLSLEETYF